jgi:FkbM family methyltransferase
MLMQGCRVVAFEPNPVAFMSLAQRFDGIEEVTCVPKGVFDSNVRARLYVPHGLEGDPLINSVGSSIYSDKENVSADKFEYVELVDIAQVLDGLAEPIALMKIDIEGAEYKVLNRLLATGKIHDIRRVLVEEHFSKVPSLEVEHNRLLNQLAALNIGNVNLNWM